MERHIHNKRGKISNSGYGYITEKGYRRIWDVNKKRYRMEHNIVWERYYGEIPNGKQIHHKDGNKLNNNITNLELVSPLEHKREHSKCEIRDGIEYKPCRKCGEYKPITNYYKRKTGVCSWCKQCCIKNAVENKRKRRKKFTLDFGL